jgi:UDP-N-acetylmuramoyl-L-alanyl-D-glutamate--2,6-diaminopimelate ligase
MKSLTQIIRNTAVKEIFDSSLLVTNLEISSLISDSRLASENCLFIAVKGTRVDGHDFASEVYAQGCRAMILERKIDLPMDCIQVIVADSALSLGELAHGFYDEPTKSLKLIGITGTNGKTTTTTLLHQLFLNLGYKAGLISTVVNKIGTSEIPSTHTTPDPISLNQLLSEMVHAGCTHCFMEVSSHAVSQHRIAGLNFAGGAFTNISHDHLDYHGTFKSYINAKKGFFDALPKTAFALTNSDDKNGMVMLQNTQAKLVTYGMHSHADYMVKVIENGFNGLLITMNNTELWTKLIGEFNAYNLATVYGVAMLLEQDSLDVLTKISSLESVDGRFQFIQSDLKITAIVDYAHTPDALKNVLQTIAQLRTRNETVFTIVGCGGDRDALKRPEMARIACELSDQVLLTSDNPRSEDPQAILNQMQEGVEPQHYMKVLSILDRDQAIKTAVSMAKPNDIILIAGKGHEKYQEVKGIKHHFDDFERVTEYLKLLKK